MTDELPDRRISDVAGTDRWRSLWPLATAAVVVALATIQLRIQGRLWWCACGHWNLWSSNIWSSHNSQHLFDPYSFTHVLHGVLFCGLLKWLAPRWPPTWRFTIAVAVESLWEIVENTQFVIDRYRTATMSVDYFGDSIVNSLGDVVTCGLGFALARRIGVWRSMLFFLATEVILLFWIRDNLFLNVLMLIHPIDSIREWQAP